MGVAAAVGVRFAVARVGPTFADVEVPMIGVHIDQLIDVLVGIDSVRHDVVRSGKDVPQVAGDRIAAEEFAVFVPVVTPGIHGAGGQNLGDLAARVISPDAAAKWQAFGVGCAWFSDFAGS